MATFNLAVKYRPVRIGFLVQDGCIEDLVKAAGMNTLLWGGIYNPVLPVSGNGSFARQLINLFSVDVLIPVSRCPEIDKILSDFPFLREPHHYGEGLFYQDWHTKKNIIAYLDAINIVSFYWEREFKHTPKKSKSNCALARWNPDDPLAHLYCIAFGFFPVEYDLQDDFEHAFVAGLKAREIFLPDVDPIKEELSAYVTPITATSLHLQGDEGSWRFDDGVYVGDENSFADLCAFWNLRAAGCDLEFLPKRHLTRFKSFIGAHIRVIDERKTSNPNIEDWVSFHYLPNEQIQINDVEIQEFVAFINQFSTKKRKTICRATDGKWNGLNLRPSMRHFQWEHCMVSVEESFGKPVVTMSLPDKKFLTKLPGSERNVDMQQFVVSIDAYSELNYAKHTLKPPFVRELNEFYSREIAFDPWTLRVEKGGIALLKNTTENSLHLYPVPHQALIEKLLQTASIKAKVSQPGLLAYQIIKSMREFSPLDACRVFKIRGARKLLKVSHRHNLLDGIVH